MRKFNSFRQLRIRMGSKTHEPGPAEKAASDGMSGATDDGSSALAEVRNAGAVSAGRLKAWARKLAGIAASVIRFAFSQAADVTAATGGRVRNRSRMAADTAASDGRDASSKAAKVSATTSQRVRANSKSALDATVAAASQLMAATQPVLASNLSQNLNSLLEGMVKGSTTIYDKAMDANYLNPLLRPDLGGSYHRLFDGGHSISGAFSAARAASPDDNIIQEALGTIQGLLRDGTTSRGLPLANWDKSTFDSVAGALESTFHIPTGWFYDLNTYDAAELLGSAVGAIAVVFSWNRADTETFARLVGGMGLSAAISANPLLLVVTVVALARAFQKARQTGEYGEFADGLLKGGIAAGTTLTAVGIVGVASGPAGAALLVGLTTSILVNAVTKRVSVVEISQFAAKRVVAVATEAKAAAQRQIAELQERGVPFSPGSATP